MTIPSIPEPIPVPFDGLDDARAVLLDGCRELLDAGLPMLPAMAALAGQHPVALVELRPFGPGEVVQALIEVLALLVPLGTDRLVLAMPGRAWSLDDPIVPVSEDVDLRQRVLLLVTADATSGPCTLTTEFHPYEPTDGGCVWDPPVLTDEVPDAPLAAALTTILDQRDELTATAEVQRLALAAQLSRALLLGHGVALAPEAADAVLAASARA